MEPSFNLAPKLELSGFFFFENGTELGPSSIFGTGPRLDFFYFFGQLAIALEFELKLGFKRKFS
jgi:hypothetical protein